MSARFGWYIRVQRSDGYTTGAAYQAGVYEALASSEYLPDWMAGISIGAINAARSLLGADDRRVHGAN